jgi:hypothetical protein
MRERRTLFNVILVWTACLSISALAAIGAVSGAQASQSPESATYRLPNLPSSLKFMVLGDFGNGKPEQYQLADQMAKVRARFPAKLVITVGDNLYGGERPQDFKRKFEDPYKVLLDAGVKFYASLGNHDSRDQSRYGLFNMDGRTFYSFKAPDENVKFVAIESDYPTPKQIAWLQQELQTGEEWIIPYFHHPLYASGKHGSRMSLRRILEPLFVKSNVAVVFTGHEHFYERIKPQQGIVHFVAGSGGQLRRGDIDRRSPLTDKGFDTDLVFLAVEIAGDSLYFSAISRTGDVIDSGVIPQRRGAKG